MSKTFSWSSWVFPFFFCSFYPSCCLSKRLNIVKTKFSIEFSYFLRELEKENIERKNVKLKSHKKQLERMSVVIEELSFMDRPDMVIANLQEDNQKEFLI